MQSIKRKEKYNPSKVKIISGITFVMGFLQACLAYVLSNFLKISSGTDNVGVFYFIPSAISIAILLFAFHKLVGKFGKANTFYFSFLIKIVALSFLIYLPPSWLAISFVMVHMIAGIVEWLSLDIILESFSIDQNSGRIRGLYLTISNAGFLLGPFFSVSILENFGYTGIFYFLLLANSFLLIFSLIFLRKYNTAHKEKARVKELFSKIWKRKNVLRVYSLSLVLNIFYAITVIYFPLHLLEQGMNWSQIGVILTIMLLPFIVIQYPMGILADRRFGEKEFIVAAVVIIGCSTAIIYLVESQSVWVWATVFFTNRIGAALLELLSESYFYKRVDARDVYTIDFFRTSSSGGYIIGAVISTITLFFFPIKAVFIVLAAVIFTALYPAFNLIDNKCEKEMIST